MANTVIVDILGPHITPQETEILTHPEVAGVILFERNTLPYDRECLCALTDKIHTLRPDIFIMTDHEGGNVQRFKRMGFRPLMSAGAIGRAYALNPEVGLSLAYEEGQCMAQDLLDIGVDVSLAPVLDLHTEDCSIIGGLDRAFHSDPRHISRLAQSYIEGMHSVHMPSVAKHFPGHGSCAGDSHLTLPSLHKTQESLENSDLKPFIDLIHENLLDAIMPAHVIYSAIDATHAATYSSKWLRTILRDELGFQGVVISDCLGMKGADIGDLTIRAQQALHAGCNLLIVANQTRETLLSLLETLPKQAIQDEVVGFQAQMARFNGKTQISSEKKYKDQFVHHSLDPKNPTQTV